MKTLTLVLPGALLPEDWLRQPQWAARIDAPEAARRIAGAAGAGYEPLDVSGGRALPRALAHEQWLAARLGLPDGTAWCAASAHADGAGEAQWRLDPVHLRAGLDHVALAGRAGGALSDEEAAALTEAIAPLLAEQDMRLAAGADGRWYLSGAQPLALEPSTPLAASGRNIAGYLPTGPDARRWRRLVTEIEMTWHLHPVNEARERAGRPRVNGLWLSGAVPTRAGRAAGLALIGEDASLAGIARLAGARLLAAGTSDPLEADAALWLDDRLLAPRLANEPDAWLEGWDSLVTQVLEPSLAALDAGRFDAVEWIATGEAGMVRHAARRTDRWRVWRRWRRASLAAAWAEPAQG